jgi:Ser/Thr protein kinase RdoA (MazF antagonist)
VDTITDHMEALEALGLDPGSCRPESISQSSPVFLASHEGRDIVVKRTRSPLPRAAALHRWTSHLARSGIGVVTPVDRLRANPVEVADEVWVAYPFVKGDPYTGSQAQIHGAGSLLGAIHAVAYDGPELGRFTWEREDEVADVRRLAEVLEGAAVTDAGALATRYEERLRRLFRVDVPALSSADLVWCNGPWDYKANNLVFMGAGPVLIDPDLSGYLPRILDLALAGVLFHNELASARGRLFTVQEWSWFSSGYQEHVELNASEREVWPSALEYMRLDEGLWLALNDPDGWHEPRQRAFLLDLLTSDLQQLRST